MASLILASQSPRRKQLLEWAEIDFEVMVSETDEGFPPELSPEAAAIHIAKEKALAVASRAKGKIILAADTIVVLEGAIIGKPKNRQDALNILKSLSGKTHEVITAVAILQHDHLISFADTTKVSFHTLTADQIAFYVDRYKPYDKAGAYAIQEWIGVIGIQSVHGDFYNVMGLPVSRVVQELNKMGYVK